MKGYHYTSEYNYHKIKIEGLLPTPFTEKDGFIESRDAEGVWLFQEPQECAQLFGVLVDCFVRHHQFWVMVELEIDFEIKDCLKALDDKDALKITYTAAIEDWVYHEKEPIAIVRELVPPDRIKLRRTFDLWCTTISGGHNERLPLHDNGKF